MKLRWLIVALLCFAAPASGFWQSRDSGYNVSVGGAVYTPQGVIFSSTAWATKATALAGVSDSKSGLISVWFKNPNAVSTQHTIFIVGGVSSAGSLVLAISGSTGKLFVNGRNAATSIILSMQSSTTFGSMSGWSHALYSWNLATSRGQTYINDASDQTASPTLTNDTVVYSGTNNDVGSIEGGANLLNGNIADLQVWFGVDVDLTTVGNRRLFIDAGLNAVDPAIAAATLGTQHILQAGASSGWETNDGSAGGFTLAAGTITNAASNPP